MELKIGDIVILKSGSIPMTVASIEGDKVNAVYYNENEGTFATVPFVAETLEVIDEDDMFDEDDYDEDDEIFEEDAEV